MEQKNAIVYCRTANVEQDINDQFEQCKKYANEHGYTIEKAFMDHGFSANVERPELKKMERYMNENPGKALIVSSYGSIHRDSARMLGFIKLAKENGNKIVAINDKNGALDQLELIIRLTQINKEVETEFEKENEPRE
ncbi:recombinase family protein [Paenibacillus thiaminolyticus]|uniref:recombinase family protein n=1 Tax=Paenibacillus thiaminolyticus TaxID=49283 RepID=UPI001161FA1E|nr:recombinase family protein [Paenibacillus thiaminolyticus]NGP58127.1 recombinase family protein [Paenibacillus thiaminolyticus]NGP58768.1 recombinase family protein [Paenibacillus thiaminolyticus]NGP60030.1 recombinase family protein [Paenibacillus thiaminolyticus]